MPSPRAAAPVAALALLVAGITGVASPAAAGDPIAEASARVEQARAEASEAARRLAAVDAERSRLESEVAAIAESIPWLRARVDRLETVVSERAAALYRNSETGPPLQFSHRADPADDARRAELAALAAARDVELAEELRGTTERLAQAESDLQVRTTELNALRDQLQLEQADFDRKVAIAEEALERAVAIGGFRAKGTTPVLGPSALSAEQIAAWFRASGGRQRIAGIGVDELASLYLEEGILAGVRGDIAFAQSMVETGAFGSIGPNNFAGLGACDSCTTMTNFPTPRDGVRAQMQHLRNYADATSRADGLGAPPSPFWYGADPDTAVRNFNGFFAKGWAPTWEAMGGGNWATDPKYAGKVLAVYDRMLGYGVE